MKIHRFYIRNLNTDKKNTALTVSDETVLHQWKNVLRFSSGQTIELFGDDGYSLLVKLLSINKKEASLEIMNEEKKDTDLLNLSLFVSCIKKENFELLTQKVTEIGVREITPILSSRSQNKHLNIDRLRKISIEATEQSGGFLPPKIQKIISLEEALLAAKRENKVVVVCDFCNTSLQDFDKKPNLDYALFVGPEGGWSEEDQEIFNKHSVQKISFGEKVLRAETAAIIGAWEFSKNNT